MAGGSTAGFHEIRHATFSLRLQPALHLFLVELLFAGRLEHLFLGGSVSFLELAEIFCAG